MGINLGAFIGPVIAGYLAQHFGWRWAFLAAAIAVPLGTLQFWLGRERLAGAGASPHRGDGGAGLAGDWRRLGIAVGVVLLVLGLCLTGVIPVDPAPLARRAAWVLVAMAAGYFAYLFLFAGLEQVERRRVVVLLSMFVACALFWAGYEQAGSSLNLFAKRFVDRTIGGFEIPAGWLQSVPPLFVIVFAPLLSMLWVGLARRMLDPAVPVKFGLAILIAGKQLSNFFGMTIPGGGHLYDVLYHFILQINEINIPVTIVAVATLLSGIAVKRWLPKIPYMIVAMLLGSVLAPAFNEGLLGDGIVIATVGALPSSLPPLSAPDFSLETMSMLGTSALAVTLFALTEAVSIGRSLAARGGYRIDGNQEFIGQGLSNIGGSFFSAYVPNTWSARSSKPAFK